MSNKPTQKTNTQSGGMNVIIGILIAAIALILIVAVVLAVSLASDSGDETAGTSADTTAGTTAGVEVSMDAVKEEIDSLQASDFEETDKTTEFVKLSVKDHGDIILRLRADVAPITVANFQKLVGNKFYDGLTFHRVIENFMIQGGDPNGDGTGNSGEQIKGEFSSNGVTNHLEHIRGVLSMARGSYSMDSASCQFFICNTDYPSLNGEYASFGYVVAGLDVVDSITAVEKNGSTPVEKVVIERACFVEMK